MAKKRKVYGEGLSSQQIITNVSRTIGHMKESTLRQAVTRLSSAMNKRLDRAAKAGELSPAMQEVMRSGGRFSAKGKTHEELKAEFIRIKQFAKDPTSTRPGWDKVKKEASEKAFGRGKGRGATPPAPIPVEEEAGDGIVDFWQGEDDTGERGDWVAPPGWEWDEESRSWYHPDYGKGWIPYEEEGGGLLDPITGEIVGNQERMYHDYDAYADDRRWGTGTEAGELWRMVDSIARSDPRFAQRHDSDPDTDPRMRLFAAIDDTWVENPTLTFEDARDMVAKRLDEIYETAATFGEGARHRGYREFLSEDEWWD